MIALYCIAVAAWLAVAAYMLPAVWSIYVRQSRHGDPARLVVFLMALFVIAGYSRRVALRDVASDGFMLALTIAAIVLAVFTAHVARSYGRGRRV